jgi:hypothetical protein
MLEKILPDVLYRQFVLSLPKALMVFFRFDSELFKGLSRIVVDELTRYMRTVTGHEDLEPGFVVWDQTFGTLPDSYHPHVCATDGGFLPDGTFVPLPRVRADPVSGTVHYQSPREHQGRNTNVISAEAVEFSHPRPAHPPRPQAPGVYLYGALSPQARKRLGLCGKPLGFTIPARTAARGRRSWARLIWKP